MSSIDAAPLLRGRDLAATRGSWSRCSRLRWPVARSAAGVERRAEPPKIPTRSRGFNRGVYKFNDALDRYALKPVARRLSRSRAEAGADRRRQLLHEPVLPRRRSSTSSCRASSRKAARTSLRLLINTTLGWGGIFDVASGARLPMHDEDSGQTLGRWGVPAGPYLVLPFLGPATLARRAGADRRRLHAAVPLVRRRNERWFSLGVNFVDKRARLLPLDRAVSKPTTRMRSSATRTCSDAQYAVYDGDPPEEHARGRRATGPRKRCAKTKRPPAARRPARTHVSASPRRRPPDRAGRTARDRRPTNGRDLRTGSPTTTDEQQPARSVTVGQQLIEVRDPGHREDLRRDIFVVDHACRACARSPATRPAPRGRRCPLR